MKRKQKFIKITAIILVVISLLSVFTAGFSVFATDTQSVIGSGNPTENITEIITEVTTENVQENIVDIENDNIDKNETVIENNESEETTTKQDNDINNSANTITTGESSVSSDKRNTYIKITFDIKNIVIDDIKSDIIYVELKNAKTKEKTKLELHKLHEYETFLQLESGTYTVSVSPDDNYDEFKIKEKTIVITDDVKEYEIVINKLVPNSPLLRIVKNSSVLIILLVVSCVGLVVIKKREEV